MGKHDPARQRAIATQLREMGLLTIEEAMYDAMNLAAADDSREIEEDYYLNRRANSVFAQIQSLGMTPNEWVGTQPVSIETSKLHSLLAEKWEKVTGRLDTSFVR